MFKVATPPDTVPEPIVVEPALNVTVPVRVPAAGAVAATVAVSCTLAPGKLEVGAAASNVDVAPLFTVCVADDDVEAAWVASPL